MPTCRSIPQAVWGHAREALIFYFSRRHGITDAEDLAQETLAAVLTREDFVFAREEDFLRVCYGFASRISYAGHRQTRKHAASELDPNSGQPPSRRSALNPAEIAVLLDEVLRTGESRLSEQEWSLIKQSITEDRTAMANQFNMGDANNVRVRLHRARRKLAKLTGWSKE
jgi:DNA-directed RNA polymerase specialized sigma24 family protein